MNNDVIADIDDELTRTLAAHVVALQERIDLLPLPRGTALRTDWSIQCGCAYDHPEDRCMVHKRMPLDPPDTEASVA